MLNIIIYKHGNHNYCKKKKKKNGLSYFLLKWMNDEKKIYCGAPGSLKTIQTYNLWSDIFLLNLRIRDNVSK